ncbi:probable Alpha-glucosidase precursor (Maltase) [Fusarium fujikuroi IMI 58289]|uniref:alpha-glucosidase n=1 Tax=Gibberella fujikuroi (strain CBS 195.34 / IMI 58289 / NRRL A-6831) TaxID=1279085 RepID=S0E7R7_GIBF5|nr:probable Alpha-glucosidase precursor (Maltase) [Fusarium fujikuroi IMI 58289]KLP05121.1 putative Alpha-glucosidase precursor (Maltase) [Fusarium fujikuroi]KLP05781.1 putative Alpha-glucosidase precursor (Maltase) [Fusarium fujikuroi]CCT70700.1 probable Alpha-glucosidase precursor (Maltase) [Fusarium fujikuroi IMI 58289]
MLNYLPVLILFIVATQAESSISTVVQSKTASPDIAIAPSLTPTFQDPHAPNPQKCPGYKATNIKRDLKGVKADLTMAGPNCQAFGNDIRDLILEVQYQTKERLNVKIFPKYLSEENRTQYILPDSLVFEPVQDKKTTISNTENIHDFHLGQNFTQTFWTNDAGIEHGNPINGNIYGVHPFYQESRYHKGSNTTSHGIYARNAHGQEWLLRPETLTYRTIGGSVDLYFLSGQNKQGGSTAIETMRQYHAGCVGLPAMQMFWTLGFHQCRLGYDTLDKIEAVVENYRAADIPLEAIWSDFDMFDGFRSFANNPVTFPPDRMAKWVDWLHENEQYYVPLVWANIYRPNPDDPKDTYGPYERGAKLKAFIRDPESGDFYTGNNWPGFVVWGDFMLPETHKWWAGELKIWYDSVPYDGMLSDLTEPASYCVGPCGNSRLDMNPVHVPFLIPGEKLRMFYEYPDGFSVTNRSEFEKAKELAANQSAEVEAAHVFQVPVTSTLGRTEPTPGVRNLTYPPYVLNNLQPGHSIRRMTISPDATHNDELNTTDMFLSISHALTHMMAGIPMFGVDICGYSHNASFDLCARWMSLGAFMPFYRNHNMGGTISQEAFVWSSVAEASRRAIAVRYSLLNYIYTLFHYANTKGDLVMRALAWEFPNDESLKATYSQFLLGPCLLVTPVLTPNSKTVRGVFPGIGEGTRWFDWYTLNEVHAKPQENVTLDAPLEHINLHIRGGTIFTLQKPGNTTAATRRNPFSLLLALDDNEYAEGSVYLDDGVSLKPKAIKTVAYTFRKGILRAEITGDYKVSPPLVNITVAGLRKAPKGVEFHSEEVNEEDSSPKLEYSNGTACVTGLERFIQNGAFSYDFQVTFKY